MKNMRGTLLIALKERGTFHLLPHRGRKGWDAEQHFRGGNKGKQGSRVKLASHFLTKYNYVVLIWLSVSL